MSSNSGSTTVKPTGTSLPHASPPSLPPQPPKSGPPRPPGGPPVPPGRVGLPAPPRPPSVLPSPPAPPQPPSSGYGAHVPPGYGGGYSAPGYGPPAAAAYPPASGYGLPAAPGYALPSTAHGAPIPPSAATSGYGAPAPASGYGAPTQASTANTYFHPTFGMISPAAIKQVFAPAPAPADMPLADVSIKDEHTPVPPQQAPQQAPQTKGTATTAPPAETSSSPADPHLNPLFGPQFPWHSAQWLRWCSPSRRDGVSSVDEDAARHGGLNRLWKICTSLKRRNPKKPDVFMDVSLNHHTIALAFLYFHIFFARQSVKRFSPEEVAGTCAFVAGKLCENSPMAPRFVLAASVSAYMATHPPPEATRHIPAQMASLPHAFDTMPAQKQFVELQSRLTPADITSLYTDRPKDLARFMLRRMIYQETVLLETMEHKLNPWSPLQEMERLLIRICDAQWLNIDLAALPNTDSRVVALDATYTNGVRVVEALMRHSTLSLQVSAETLAVAAIHAAARLAKVSAALRKPGAPMPWYTSICGLSQRAVEPVIEEACRCRHKVLEKVRDGGAVRFGYGIERLRAATAEKRDADARLASTNASTGASKPSTSDSSAHAHAPRQPQAKGLPAGPSESAAPPGPSGPRPSDPRDRGRRPDGADAREADATAIKTLAALATAPSDVPARAEGEGQSAATALDQGDEDHQLCPSPPAQATHRAAATPTPLPLLVSTPTPMVRSHSGRAADEE